MVPKGKLLRLWYRSQCYFKRLVFKSLVITMKYEDCGKPTCHLPGTFPSSRSFSETVVWCFYVSTVFCSGSDCEAIEHWIKTFNEFGHEEQGWRTLLAINIWDTNLTKCFVSTLDAHLWCIFSLLFIKGVLDLSQRLVYAWSYPRIITLEKVAWINSMKAEYCFRKSYLEYQGVWLLCLDCSFSAFSGI